MCNSRFERSRCYFLILEWWDTDISADKTFIDIQTNKKQNIWKCEWIVAARMRKESSVGDGVDLIKAHNAPIWNSHTLNKKVITIMNNTFHWQKITNKRRNRWHRWCNDNCYEEKHIKKRIWQSGNYNHLYAMIRQDNCD